MFEILKNFEAKFGGLKKKGLRIEGLSMIDPKRKKTRNCYLQAVFV